jgi:hypothetical protein
MAESNGLMNEGELRIETLAAVADPKNDDPRAQQVRAESQLVFLTLLLEPDVVLGRVHKIPSAA